MRGVRGAFILLQACGGGGMSPDATGTTGGGGGGLPHAPTISLVTALDVVVFSPFPGAAGLTF